MQISRLPEFELRRPQPQEPQPQNWLRLILAYLSITALVVSGLVLLNKQERPPNSESPAFFGP